LLVLLVALLGACAAPAAAPTGAEESAPAAEADAAAATDAQAGGTLTMSLGDDFVTFHPYFDVTNANFKPTFFEAPIRIGDDGQFEAWLAESWEESEDGLTVTLRLRQGVMFHNGREMTADDVVWSVEHARNTEFGHHLSDRFTTATGAEKVDEYTVAISYGEMTQSKLDGIARLYIFPQEALENIETQPVGTGPFQFVEWTPGDQLVAEKFEEYWREGLPYLDEVVVKPIPDTQARLVNLSAGSIDALVGVPLADIALLESDANVVVGQAPPGFTFYAFIMNVNREPFNNVLVRQAMNYAIDRDKIRDTAFHGKANTTKLPFAETSWAYPADLADFYTYDPEKAKELLTEAGYPDGFDFQLVIRGAGGAYLDMAQVYQQDLAAIGVNAEIVPTELPQYWPILFESDFAMVSHGTGEATVDPSGLFEGAACCRPFRNFFGITEDTEWFPGYKDLIDQARGSQDQAERTELYHQAMQILLEQGWTIPVAWEQTAYAYKTTVHDFRTDMDGLIWLGETWVEQ
jgi:peptide/nickel transport system substrate-binding protein